MPPHAWLAPDSSDPDVELAQLALAARDDQLAREELIAQTHRFIRRFAAAFAGEDAADDITQDTCIRVLRSLHRYDPERAFLPWVLTIARRVAIDELRASERRRRMIAKLDRQPKEPPPGLETREIGDLVRRLEPARRLAFVLTQVLGYDYTEAARIARCPVGTIRSRVHRARTELVTLLADH
jgi:RNA polymerase sigma-70 factor (ECF subfamily)